MTTAIILAPEGSEPEAVAETARTISPAVEAVTVVCDADRRDAIATTVDARTIADKVPDGGSVAAMRAGLRATSSATAIVTTPAAPTLPPSAVADLAPTSDADAALVETDGGRHLPLGGYTVGPTLAACDVTLATGSRRFADVLSRLSVTTRSISIPRQKSNARAKHES